MPVFGYTAVPLQVKAALGFVMAIVLAPATAIHLTPTYYGPMMFFGVAMQEALIGLTIGAATLLLLMGAEFAGTLIGLQMGFSIVNLFDPAQEQEVSIIGRFEYLLALMIFISLDMHHLLIAAVGDSFLRIPIGTAVLDAKVALAFAKMTADVFAVAVKLAGPVLAILLLTEIALGFVSRAMPQMNVFIVSFPLKVGVGLLGMAVTWPLFAYVLAKHYDRTIAEIIKLITVIGGK